MSNETTFESLQVSSEVYEHLKQSAEFHEKTVNDFLADVILGQKNGLCPNCGVDVPRKGSKKFCSINCQHDMSRRQASEELSDAYVRLLLSQNTKLTSLDIPIELVRLKRIKHKLDRLILEREYENS